MIFDSDCAGSLGFQNFIYWPDLDVDLSVQSIRNPSAFPLVSGEAPLGERDLIRQ